MKLDIKRTTDPILRTPAEKVEIFDEELEKLIDDMIETMRSSNGIGLAAPQVGVSKRVLVCEFQGDKEREDGKYPPIPLTVLCNPEIIEQSKEEINMVEGCLSFPGLELLIKRPKKIKIKGLDRYGKEISIEADGLYARVLQHEFDHLNSTLLIDHLQSIDVVFIGTGTLGVPTLERLAADPQYHIKLVVTGDIKTTGRKSTEIVNPIAETAKKYNLPLIKTENINSESAASKIREANPQLGIMADFGQLIKEEVLLIPPFGIVNIHPSLLPKHRGPSPVQQTILDGDKISGVCLILTTKKMDAGDIISCVSVKLQGSETSTILKNFLAEIAATHLLNTIPYYLAGDMVFTIQNEKNVTFSRLFKKEDGLVDKDTPASIVERKIRAFDVWPKVYTIVKGKRVQLLAAHFDRDKNLLIDRVKPEGKKEMSYDEFVRGYHTKLEFR